MARLTLGLSSSEQPPSRAITDRSPLQATSARASTAASLTSGSSWPRRLAAKSRARSSPFASTPSARLAAARTPGSSRRLQTKTTTTSPLPRQRGSRFLSMFTCLLKLPAASSCRMASRHTTMVSCSAGPPGAERAAGRSASARTADSWTTCWYFCGTGQCLTILSFKPQTVSSCCTSKSMESPATFRTTTSIMPRACWTQGGPQA
mmetsp:Transcript_76368/g.223978  ORF Transcript_76368/g.223978 Transcript_76368/m.223978 type:complete len:206 (-) Transcript_76368:8-625(-)